MEHGAVSGSIIVMDPHQRVAGDGRQAVLLAQRRSPYPRRPRRFNPLISAAYEPGRSLTHHHGRGARLGTVTPETTYNDTGAIEVGGLSPITGARGARGVVDMTTLLARSLNVGAATIATWMGPTTFTIISARFRP